MEFDSQFCSLLPSQRGKREISKTHFRRAKTRNMRCYFLKDGHIANVELLQMADDQDLIAQSEKLYEARSKPRGAEGFEVWDGGRFVYRWPSGS